MKKRKNVPLNWDSKRHDEVRRKTNEVEMSKRGRELVAGLFLKWKKRLCKKSCTPQELIAELYKLRDMVADAVKHSPGMKEYRVFTMNLIEDKISDVLKTDFASKNMITEWLDEERRQDAAGLLVAEKAEFQTFEEFQAVPFVRKFLVMEDFVGFYSSGKFINALFQDGEIFPVGLVLSSLGLERLPTHKEICAALDDLPSAAGEAGSAPASPTDTGRPGSPKAKLPGPDSGTSKPGSSPSA